MHSKLRIVLPSRFLCVDCGVNTNQIDEYYMVHDAVWDKANGPRRGMLCIGCLEQRLGRQLSAHDFTEFPVNFIYPQSTRLANRLWSVPISVAA